MKMGSENECVSNTFPVPTYYPQEHTSFPITRAILTSSTEHQVEGATDSVPLDLSNCVTNVSNKYAHTVSLLNSQTIPRQQRTPSVDFQENGTPENNRRGIVAKLPLPTTQPIQNATDSGKKPMYYSSAVPDMPTPTPVKPVPIDLSPKHDKFNQHPDASISCAHDPSFVFQNSNNANLNRNPSKCYKAYQVDEGIKPLCLMESSEEEEEEDTDTDQSLCLSRPQSLASTSGESTASSLIDPPAILSGDHISISHPVRHRAMGWKDQRLYPCNNGVFETALDCSKHQEDGCDDSPKEIPVPVNMPTEETQTHSPDIHISMVQEKKPEKRDRGIHICNTCNATYKARGALGRHIARVHSNNGMRKTVLNKDQMPVCPVCGDWFTTVQRFRSHLKVHREWDLSTYIYSCTVCGGRYAQEEQLERHIKRVHCQTNPTKHTKQAYNKFSLHPHDGDTATH